MQEKEKQISQIQNLLESNDSENINLAFQLMEGLDLQKEVLSIYNIKNLIKTSSSLLIEGKASNEFNQFFIQKIAYIFPHILANIQKKVSIASCMLAHHFSDSSFYFGNDRLEITLDINLYDKVFKITRETYSNYKQIKNTIKSVQSLNSISFEEAIQKLWTEPSDHFIDPERFFINYFIDTDTQDSKNPIEYKLIPHNEEYSKLSLSVVVDY